ncbi:hypothetical protein [Mycobacteroides abscessus]|uniref:hypothetical protein n=1 Tax=Mycobacteroides abscessus TaxID=36809 RepID=UPI001A97AB9D
MAWSSTTNSMIMTQLAAGSADLSPNSGTVLSLPIGRTHRVSQPETCAGRSTEHAKIKWRTQNLGLLRAAPRQHCADYVFGIARADLLSRAGS